MTEIWWYFGVATCVKLLLIPAYHSTDFEVHRHWLALTRSLPLSQWYSDETSPWTLDYPPFFAFFERFLSIFAFYVDPKIVHLHDGLNYKSPTAIYFQRISVMASDLCLLYAVHRLSRVLEPCRRKLMWILVLWSPMLFIVDHIHFQYNGFLLGLLMLSVSYLMEGRDLAGGFLFAVLLCFKHLFAVAGPLYFVYLLRHFCCNGGLVRSFGRLLAIGTAVVAVFAVAYGPFIYHGQGLCHAYWAPNFWVFYIIADKVSAFVLRKLGLNIELPAASFTGGLVGDMSPFAVLPRVTPLITFILVLLALSPCLIKAWRKPQPGAIARWIAYAYTCGFLYGWHVHEKASLHFVIPLAISAAQSLEDAKHYFLISIVSCYSLFPLLYEAQEYPIKVLLLILHSVLMWLAFSALFDKSEAVESSAQSKKRDDSHKTERKPKSPQNGVFRIGPTAKIYLLGLLMVELYGQILHPYFLGSKLPFLPLMLMSTYCAVGVMYSWIWQLRQIISSS